MTRECVVDDGGTNSETEIGRISHCGVINWMVFNGTYVKGCILTCDTDGCNTASYRTSHSCLVLCCCCWLLLLVTAMQLYLSDI